MAPETQSPLEALHRRVMREEKVTEADIDKAVGDEETKLKEKLKDNPYELQQRLDRLNSFKDTLKREKDNLVEAYKQGRLDFFKESRNLWAEVKEIASLVKRPAEFKEARDRMSVMTDPKREGEQVIDDYEGWGPGWVTETSNSNNATRHTLTGYLTAMEMHDPKSREAAYNQAYDIYKSWTGDVLKYSELEEDMGLKKHLDELAKYMTPPMEDEPKGYLAGCLQIAEAKFGPMNVEYRKYLFTTADEVWANIKMPAALKDPADKGKFQMAALSAVLTPREWMAMSEGVRSDFTNLVQNAMQLAVSLGIEFSADVIDFLKRDPLSISNADAGKITDIKDLITAEAFSKIGEKKTAIAARVDDAEKKFAEVEGKNATGKKFADGQIKELKDIIAKAKADIGAFVLASSTTFEDLIAGNSALDTIGNRIFSAETSMSMMLAALDATGGGAGGGGTGGTGGSGGGEGGGEGTGGGGTDVYKNKWAAAELVDSRWKSADVRVSPNLSNTPYRDDTGEVKGNIPGGTNLRIVDVNAKARQVEGVTFVEVEYDGKEVWVDEAALILGEGAGEGKEAREREAFIKEKNLLEVEAGKKYLYMLDRGTASEVNGELHFDFINPDVNRIFRDKFNAYVGPLTKKLKAKGGSPDKLFDTVKQEQDPRKLASALTGTLKDFFSNKEVEKLVAAFIVLAKASRDSAMIFDGAKPKVDSLKGEYNRKFIPAWETAARDMDKLAKGGEIESPPDGTEGGSKLNADVMKMLGGIEPAYKYAEASNLIAAYSRNPEKYPNGVTVRLPLNNGFVSALVYLRGGQGVIEFRDNPAKRYINSSLNTLMRNLHKGVTLEQRQYDIMSSEASYKQYEGYIGQLDDLEKLADYDANKVQWTHKLEFDWPGTDPDIWIRPAEHGRIVYAIDRSNAAPDGGDVRKGYCENFNAFLVAMKRMRDWTERYDDIPEGARATEAHKERQYDRIIHPDSFRKYPGRFGRVVQQKTKQNGVDLVLDWGGGNNVNSRKNAKLSVWVAGNGDINYQLYREDVNRVEASGTVRGVDDVRKAVYKLKDKYAS